MNHPITPPPELVYEWKEQASCPGNTTAVIQTIARWGADQELEACCEWIHNWYGNGSGEVVGNLIAARRPKPPSLKEQALDELTSAERLYPADWSTIRRALEALPE
jgi:hypothetical protein